MAEPIQTRPIPADDTFRLLVDGVRDYAIYLLDAQGYVASWNVGAERINGYRADEIVGQHFSKFYPAEDIAAGKPDFELEIARRTGRLEDEGWRVRKDGTQFWANVIVTALHDDDGKLIAFAKVTRDLTQRKYVEESLRQSEERFRLIVENIADYAIFMLDRQGRIATWNQGAARIKQWTADEILGKPLSTFYAPEDVAAGKPARLLEEARVKGRVEDEGWRVRKDGTRFWADVVITALFDDDGDLRGYAKVTRDLTERKLSEEFRSRFIANAAHELRTPITTIVGFSQLLEDRHQMTEEQIEDCVAALNRGGIRLVLLIGNLLDLSGIEQGQMTLRPEPTSIRDAVTQALEAMPSPPGKTVRTTVPGTVVANVDPMRLQQILTNLISNTYRYGGENILVDARRDGDRVFVDVSDDGNGVPENLVAALFEPFTRGESSTGFLGSGLGLSIVRTLALASNGNVSYEPNAPRGAKFTLTLPAAPVEPTS